MGNLPTHVLACFAAILLAMAAPAQAGTAEDPEILDPADDTSSPMSGQDIVAVWFDEEPGSVEEFGEAIVLNVVTAGDFQHLPGFFALHMRYRVAFTTDTMPEGVAEYYVNVVPSLGTTSATGQETVGCRLGLAAEPGASMALGDETDGTKGTVAAMVAPNHFTCNIAISLLAGFSFGSAVRDLYAEHQLVQRGPLSGAPPAGGDHAGVHVLETFDRAPDSDFGREWPAPAEPGPEEGGTEGNETNSTSTSTTTGPPSNTTTTASETTDPTLGEETTSANTTGSDPVDQQAEKSPGLAFWAILLATAIALVASRRR